MTYAVDGLLLGDLNTFFLALNAKNPSGARDSFALLCVVSLSHWSNSVYGLWLS